MTWDGKTDRRSNGMDAESKELLRNIAGSLKSERKIFGFKMQEIAIIVALFITLIGFYIRTNEAMDHLILVTDYLTKFSRNSDVYHSTSTGVQFEQGRPLVVDAQDRGPRRRGSNYSNNRERND